MAFDYSRLRGKIIERYGTCNNFAKALRISDRTLSLKLNGHRFFSQLEIDKVLALLGIAKSDIALYFFTQKVQ